MDLWLREGGGAMDKLMAAAQRRLISPFVAVATEIYLTAVQVFGSNKGDNFILRVKIGKGTTLNKGYPLTWWVKITFWIPYPSLFLLMCLTLLYLGARLARYSIPKRFCQMRIGDLRSNIGWVTVYEYIQENGSENQLFLKNLRSS